MENLLEMPKEEKLETQKEEKKKGRRPQRRQIVIACAVLLVAVALALNFVLFGQNDPVEPEAGGTEGTGEGTVTTATDGYFSATQVSRQRARDEALEVLQGVVENENADEATKTGALLEISQLAKEMEAEANIEAMVLAKGFSQCVAIVNGDSCSVVVNGESLQPNQISQINEIVYEQTGILPASIRIVTK